MERMMQNRMKCNTERKIGRGFKDEMKKQNNAWAVYKKYGQTTY